MRITIFYFSGTGNTWWVSEKIKSILRERGHEAETYSIERKDINWDDMIPRLLADSDIIGIGFPVHSSTIPIIMKSWVKDHLWKHAKGKINGKRAFVYDTMAYFSGDTPLLMKKLLKKCGFKVRQAINIRTLSNLPQMKRLMTWEKGEQEKIFQKAEAKIQKLIDCVLEGKKWLMRRDPLSRMVAGFQRLGWKFEGKSFSKLFTFDNDMCNLCNLCVKYCPVGNLEVVETEHQPIIKYGSNCIYCMRCFNSCPQNAIIVMKRTRDIEKYPRFRGQVPGFKLSRVRKDNKKV